MPGEHAPPFDIGLPRRQSTRSGNPAWGERPGEPCGRARQGWDAALMEGFMLGEPTGDVMAGKTNWDDPSWAEAGGGDNDTGCKRSGLLS